MSGREEAFPGRVVVVGLGLIGGSLAGALRAAGHYGEILGWARSPDTLQRAESAGLVDGGGADLAELSGAADLVFIAVPISAIAGILQVLKPAVEKGSVVTDVASVKEAVLSQVRQVFGQVPPGFVPGHPLAGSEKSGIDAADRELFRGRLTVLTPLADTAPEALAQVRAAWEATGARVTEMSAVEHDAALAATSHLPHLLAYVLMDMLAERGGETLLRLSAGGLRDFSRIAGAEPALWRDIALANREALLEILDAYSDALMQLQKQLAAGEGDALEARFRRARQLRAALEPGSTGQR